MDIAPLILGDGSPLKPIGVLRRAAFDFIDSDGKPLSHTSDFVVLDPLDEKLIIGHQFFMEGYTNRQVPRKSAGEISYAKQSLVFGRKMVPWKYEITMPALHIAMTLKDNSSLAPSQFLICLYDTKIHPLSHSSVHSAFPGRCSAKDSWGFFSNICPVGSKLSLHRMFRTHIRQWNYQSLVYQHFEEGDRDTSRPQVVPLLAPRYQRSQSLRQQRPRSL